MQTIFGDKNLNAQLKSGGAKSLNLKDKLSAGPQKKRQDTALPIPSKETDDADIQGLEEDFGGGKSKLPLALIVNRARKEIP